MDSVSIQKIAMWITSRNLHHLDPFSVDNLVDDVENCIEYSFLGEGISMQAAADAIFSEKKENPVRWPGQRTAGNLPGRKTRRTQNRSAVHKISGALSKQSGSA